jgi:hypothetical protein
MTAYLLVEVPDEDQAASIAEQIEQGTDGVRTVYNHGQGCCCQHCPHNGNCRD